MNSKTWIYWALAVAAPTLIAIVVAHLIAFSTEPMPVYFGDAVQIATHGYVQNSFSPAGYPLFIAAGIKVLGIPIGIEVVQALIFVALAILVCSFQVRLGIPAKFCLLTSICLCFHPELLLNVEKVWDITLSTLLFVALLYCLTRMLTAPAITASIAVCGIVWGLGMFERPNFLLLGVVVAYAVYRQRRAGLRGGRLAVSGLLVLVFAVASFSLCSWMAHRAVVTPGNGPYNYFAGNNPLTETALLRDLNAEPSIVPALADAGIHTSEADLFSGEYKPQLTRLAWRYNLTHPSDSLRLILVKLYTFLRPDTKIHGVLTPPGLVKSALALILPVWTLIIVIFRNAGWDEVDKLFMLASAAYLLPFLLTNSDPRFRTPLEVLAVIHSVRILCRARSSSGTTCEAETEERRQR